jgi:hypothetical protein
MFRVDYLASVLDAMARIWVQADPITRQTITLAADEIDQILQQDPAN